MPHGKSPEPSAQHPTSINRAGRHPGRGRFAQWLLIIAGLLLLSPAIDPGRGLDNFANEQLSEALGETGRALAIAIGLDALISFLQSAEIGIGVLSGHPGEFLDPLNDVVERLSWVLAWALGSLALQKMVLASVTGAAFKLVVFLAGLAAAATHLLLSAARTSVFAARLGVLWLPPSPSERDSEPASRGQLTWPSPSNGARRCSGVAAHPGKAQEYQE